MNSEILVVLREEAWVRGPIAAEHASAILAARRLAQSGCRVAVIRAEDLPDRPPRAALILSMARAPRSLEILERCRGAIINPPGTIRALGQESPGPALAAAGLLVPRTMGLPLDQLAQAAALLPLPFWVKAAGTIPTHTGAVQFVDDPGCLRSLQARWSMQGVTRVLLHEHVDGPVERIGAVPAAEFVDGPASALPLLERIAAALQLSILGAEIVRAARGPTVVSVTDWPAFARAPEAAAAAIAQLAHRRLLSTQAA